MPEKSKVLEKSRVSGKSRMPGKRRVPGKSKMPERKRGLRPDTVLKNYWEDNGRFADLFNAVLFAGEEVIRAEDLEDADTESSTVLTHKGYAESIRASRDNIKKLKRPGGSGVQFVLLGQEHQEQVHYAMPIRVMGYDYSAYKKQYDSNAKKYRASKGLKPEEYLSKMKKGDHFIPVITLVIHYGEKPWDGAKSLHELLDIPSGMEKYINDYKIILIEARENQLMLRHPDNVDFFRLLSILQDTGKPAASIREEILDYTREHEVGDSVLMAAAGAARCKVDYDELGQERGNVMYRVFEELVEEGRLEGRLEEREKGVKAAIGIGVKCGMPDEAILEILQKEINLSLEEAKGYLERFGKQMAE